MSILKSNSASIYTEPINDHWLRNHSGINDCIRLVDDQLVVPIRVHFGMQPMIGWKTGKVTGIYTQKTHLHGIFFDATVLKSKGEVLDFVNRIKRIDHEYSQVK